MGFPDISVGKASNAGDTGLIPGSGRSAGEGIFLGIPCALTGKESNCNVGDLGWKDTMEKEKATHSSILD